MCLILALWLQILIWLKSFERVGTSFPPPADESTCLIKSCNTYHPRTFCALPYTLWAFQNVDSCSKKSVPHCTAATLPHSDLRLRIYAVQNTNMPFGFGQISRALTETRRALQAAADTICIGEGASSGPAVPAAGQVVRKSHVTDGPCCRETASCVAGFANCLPSSDRVGRFGVEDWAGEKTEEATSRACKDGTKRIYKMGQNGRPLRLRPASGFSSVVLQGKVN